MAETENLRERLKRAAGAPAGGGGGYLGDMRDVRRKLAKLLAEKAKTVLPGHEPAPPVITGAQLRDVLAARRAAGKASTIVYRREPVPVAPKRRAPRALVGEPVALEEAVPGEERHHHAGGRAWCIEATAVEADERGCDVNARLRAALGDPTSNLSRQAEDRCGVRPALDSLVFVDLETTGLGATPLFLVGAMTWRDDGLLVRQYLARNYAEEAPAIRLFLEDVAGARLLVSFNGKSFDLPYLRLRAAANRIAFDFKPPHFDILHPSRRAWRKGLPDCRLKTLEREICGCDRADDIPGDEIPEAYHAFVRSGDARQIVEILHHNLFDLVTMADLLTRLPAP